MPRKPLGLRPIRESAKRDMTVPKVSLIAWLIGDGTVGATLDDVARDRDEAAAAWPHYRRLVWSRTQLTGLSRSAEIFDGLQTSGVERLRSVWDADVLPLTAIFQALDADRAAVRRFQQRDPRGAASIADYLAVFVAGLDRVKVEARRLAGKKCAHGWMRGYPDLSSGSRYGDDQPVPHPPPARQHPPLDDDEPSTIH